MKYIKIVLILLAAFALKYTSFSGQKAEAVVASSTDLAVEAEASF